MLVMEKKVLTANPSHIVNLYLEYSLIAEERELEGNGYIGYGVSVKMVDEYGEETIASIEDITTEPQHAENLFQLIKLSTVSPKCLKIFVENFLENK